MIVNLGTQGSLQISFIHRQVPNREKLDTTAVKPLRLVYGLPYDIRGVTNCLIVWSGIESEINAIGNAFCSYKDNYSKSKGRKTSLKRALENLGVNKEIRKQVWCEYLKIKTQEKQDGLSD